VVKVRVTSAKRALRPLRADGEDAVSKPACFARSRSSSYKREPIVPIGLAGMALRRGTSSVTRCAGHVSPATLFDFPPGAILQERLRDVAGSIPTWSKQTCRL